MAAGVRLNVRLTPRGGRDALDGIDRLDDGQHVVRARVRAAPEAGEANAALERLLAKAFGVPKSAVAVVKGAASRQKIVAIAAEPAAVARTIETLRLQLGRD